MFDKRTTIVMVSLIAFSMFYTTFFMDTSDSRLTGNQVMAHGNKLYGGNNDTNQTGNQSAGYGGGWYAGRYYRNDTNQTGNQSAGYGGGWYAGRYYRNDTNQTGNQSAVYGGWYAERYNDTNQTGNQSNATITGMVAYSSRFGKADLTIDHFVVNVTNSTNSTNSSAMFFASVQNIGTRKASNTITRIATDPAGTQIGHDIQTPPLNPGQTYYVYAWFEVTPGFHYASVKTDYTDLVTESNEQNNVQYINYYAS